MGAVAGPWSGAFRSRSVARAVQTGISRRGYAVVGLLDDGLRGELRAAVDALGLEEDHPFFASIASAWGPVAREAHRELSALLRGTLAAALPDHRLFMSAVTSKGRDNGSSVPFHQDWTYTDERRHRTIFLWCPLVGAGPRNGGLRVIPGSHRWTQGLLRPSRSLEATQHLQSELSALSVPVTLEPGEVLAFDPGMVHGSGPNPTSAPRPALTLALAPHGAQLVHFHLDHEGRTHGFRVDDDFFTEHPYGRMPQTYPPLDPWADPVREDDLRATLQDRRSRSRARHAARPLRRMNQVRGA